MHRDYRERERDRDKEDRYTSSSSRGNYGKHSRGNSRVRWTTHDTDCPPSSSSTSHHRGRRHDGKSNFLFPKTFSNSIVSLIENTDADMEISPDSTPTSEASYSHHSGTPTATTNNNNSNNNNSNNLGNSEQSVGYSGNALPRILSSSTTNSSSSTPTAASGSSHHHHHHHGASAVSSGVTNSNQLLTKLTGVSVGSTASPSSLYSHHMHLQGHPGAPQMDVSLSSNAPGPPPANGGVPVVLGGTGLPKILSHSLSTGVKTLEALEHQKSLQISRQHSVNSVGAPGLLDGSPLYNIVNHSSVVSAQTPLPTTNYYSNSASLVQQVSVRSESGGGAGVNSSLDGPPTPTQEKDLLDMMDIMVPDHRKCKGFLLVSSREFLFKFLLQIPVETPSTSLLHCVMTQASRSQGPNLTPTLANYCREDLIQHIKHWPAEYLEQQVNFQVLIKYFEIFQIFHKNPQFKQVFPNFPRKFSKIFDFTNIVSNLRLKNVRKKLTYMETFNVVKCPPN